VPDHRNVGVNVLLTAPFAGVPDPVANATVGNAQYVTAIAVFTRLWLYDDPSLPRHMIPGSGTFALIRFTRYCANPVPDVCADPEPSVYEAKLAPVIHE
jgi:hypothetical protein